MSPKKTNCNQFITEEEQLDRLLMKWVDLYELKPPETDQIKRNVMDQDLYLPELFWESIFTSINSSMSITNQLMKVNLVKY